MIALESAQVIVAAVLAWTLAASGWAKVRRPFAAALAMVRFGLARRIRARNGRVAGAVEVVTGLLLVVPLTSWAGFAAAAALGLLFTTIVARALMRGERFECACFGEAGGQLSVFTLARAVFLLLLAFAGLAVALAGSRPSLGATGHLFAVAAGLLLVLAVSLVAALVRERPFTSRLRPLAGES